MDPHHRGIPSFRGKSHSRLYKIWRLVLQAIQSPSRNPVSNHRVRASERKREKKKWAAATMIVWRRERQIDWCGCWNAQLLYLRHGSSRTQTTLPTLLAPSPRSTSPSTPSATTLSVPAIIPIPARYFYISLSVSRNPNSTTDSALRVQWEEGLCR